MHVELFVVKSDKIQANEVGEAMTLPLQFYIQ